MNGTMHSIPTCSMRVNPSSLRTRFSCDTGLVVVESGVVRGSCSACKDDVQTAIDHHQGNANSKTLRSSSITSTTPPVCWTSRTIRHRSLEFYSSFP
jgi:hypothetical protein